MTILGKAGAGSTLLAVTGMKREAVLFPHGNSVVVSGGDIRGLTDKIESEIARDAKAVISAGICGGLRLGLPVGAVVLATEIVSGKTRLATDRAWREAMGLRIQDAVSGPIAGSATILTRPIEKMRLHDATGALAVDMESHIAAAVAAKHGLPFAALRVISDAAEHGLPPAVLSAIDAEGKLRLGRVLASIARNPAQIPGLIRTGRTSDVAMKRLLRCFDLMGVGFACPYLG